MRKLIQWLRSRQIWRDLFNLRTFKQFYRYLVVGFLSFATETSLLYLLTDHFKLWYLYSNSIAYIVVFWLNFLLNRFWAFQARNNFQRQMVLFLILFIFNLFASNAMMYFLTSVLKVYYLISKVFAVALVVSWNFILYKKVIYRT